MNETHSTSTTASPATGASVYLIPLAIVVGFGLVAAAIFFSGAPMGSNAVTGAEAGTPTPVPSEGPDTLEALRPVSEEDHIKGTPNAAVTIVEYSDFECPFCKRFHDTMNRVVAARDDVAWVYRHFPLEQLHPVKARAEAVASECAAELGGNDAFWQFTDGFFARTPSNNRTEIETVIPELVREIGLDQAAFAECFESGRYDEHIKADTQNAVDTGGRGTPWSIVIGPDGKKYPLSGAQPYAAVVELIELAKNAR